MKSSKNLYLPAAEKLNIDQKARNPTDGSDYPISKPCGYMPGSMNVARQKFDITNTVRSDS